MDDLRLFNDNGKPSDDQPSHEPREFIVYFFFFIAVTAFAAVLSHWSEGGAVWEIGTAVLAGAYYAGRLITSFRKRQ
ncbi:MAG: hypothetical protein WCE50_04500 [Candidatus Acidiferrum sp.]